MIRVVLLLVALSAALPLAAQQPAPAFETASVKRNVTGSLQRRLGALPGGRFTAVNVTALQLIQWGYQLSRTRIVGATGWLSSDQFDVEARATGEVPPPRVRQMVKQLLAARFGLVVHTEQRELQAFALVPDHRDTLVEISRAP
jgi:uncharacterized protein (TIGR03435 family)